jgi:hypothetical protein
VHMSPHSLHCILGSSNHRWLTLVVLSTWWPGDPVLHFLDDLSVIRLIVSLLTDAPYISAKCALISPVVNPLA